mmetsp:Transcript_80602/g.215928  ORF Transcript_80602/g.215928 Transcript_80602/m.215928 type:complete len:105 (+) Transcript_80602:445-759(+)
MIRSGRIHIGRRLKRRESASSLHIVEYEYLGGIAPPQRASDEIIDLIQSSLAFKCERHRRSRCARDEGSNVLKRFFGCRDSTNFHEKISYFNFSTGFRCSSWDK